MRMFDDLNCKDIDKAYKQMILGYKELAEENKKEAEFTLPVIFNDLISPNKLPKGLPGEELAKKTKDENHDV